MVLYLLGTIHWDYKGPRRVKKFLKHIRPEKIGLEYSADSIEICLQKRKETLDLIASKSDIDPKDPEADRKSTIRKIILAQGYEVWASYEHKQKYSNVTIVPIHDNLMIDRSDELYSNIGKLVGSGNLSIVDVLKTIDLSPLINSIDEIYYEDKKPLDGRLLEVVQEADEIMEKNIRREYGGETFVAIVGGGHFYGRQDNNLYERLKDLSPRLLRLPDVDKL